MMTDSFVDEMLLEHKVVNLCWRVGGVMLGGFGEVLKAQPSLGHTATRPSKVRLNSDVDFERDLRSATSSDNCRGAMSGEKVGTIGRLCLGAGLMVASGDPARNRS